MNTYYREWYLCNRDKILRERKEAYQRRKQYLNKLKLSDFQFIDIEPEVYKCEVCQTILCKTSKYQHEKTKYHKFNLEILNSSFESE